MSTDLFIILSSDWVDSTATRTRIGEEPADALQVVHDALLRNIIGAHGGHPKGICRSVGALESRALVTARKFVDLKAATAADGELAPPQPVEAVPRPLLAPELAPVRELGGGLDRVVRVS
jgi:hypothetical protein